MTLEINKTPDWPVNLDHALRRANLRRWGPDGLRVIVRALQELGWDAVLEKRTLQCRARDMGTGNGQVIYVKEQEQFMVRLGSRQRGLQLEQDWQQVAENAHPYLIQSKAITGDIHHSFSTSYMGDAQEIAVLPTHPGMLKAWEKDVSLAKRYLMAPSRDMRTKRAKANETGADHKDNAPGQAGSHPLAVAIANTLDSPGRFTPLQAGRMAVLALRDQGMEARLVREPWRATGQAHEPAVVDDCDLYVVSDIGRFPVSAPSLLDRHIIALQVDLEVVSERKAALDDEREDAARGMWTSSKNRLSPVISAIQDTLLESATAQIVAVGPAMRGRRL